MATLIATAADSVYPRRISRNVHFEEGASQTYTVGAPVVLSSGQVVKGGSDPTANTLVGFASENATGVQGTRVGVWVADEQAEFVGRVQDTGTLAAANRGAQYGLVLDATNDIMRVDLSDTSNKRVTVIGLLDEVGDVNGRVVFKVMNAARTPYWS